MDYVGLRKPQDITTELQKNRIKMNSSQLQRFIANIKQNVNPFTADLDKTCLYNTSTGQAAKDEIADFLLNIEENGNKQRLDFIHEMFCRC